MKYKTLNYSLLGLILISFSACNQKTNLRNNDSYKQIETLIKDLDNDGKMDSVFLYQNPYSFVECKLSILNYKTIKSGELDFDSRLNSESFGFSFDNTEGVSGHTQSTYGFKYNSSKKNMQLIYKRSIYYYNLGHSDDAKLKELYFDDYEKRWQGSINHINTIWHDVETNENIKDVISIETDTVTYEESSIHEYMPMEEGKHFGNEIIFLDSDFEKMRNL